jgi:hypothetical protein
MRPAYAWESSESGHSVSTVDCVVKGRMHIGVVFVERKKMCTVKLGLRRLAAWHVFHEKLAADPLPKAALPTQQHRHVADADTAAATSRRG